MNTIDTVAELLESLNLRFRRYEDDELIDISFTGDNTVYVGTIRARGSLVTVYGYNVLVVPRPRLDETIRVVNLLNSQKVGYGAFWVDVNRLRVCFEMPIAAPDGVTREQVSMAMSALSQIDDYYPIIAAVIWGGQFAETAMNPPAAVEPPVLLDEDADPPLDMAV